MIEEPVVVLVARVSEIEQAGITGLSALGIESKCSGCNADVLVSNIIVSMYGDQFPYVCSDCYDWDPRQVQQ